MKALVVFIGFLVFAAVANASDRVIDGKLYRSSPESQQQPPDAALEKEYSEAVDMLLKSPSQALVCVFDGDPIANAHVRLRSIHKRLTEALGSVTMSSLTSMSGSGGRGRLCVIFQR